MVNGLCRGSRRDGGGGHVGVRLCRTRHSHPAGIPPPGGVAGLRSGRGSRSAWSRARGGRARWPIPARPWSHGCPGRTRCRDNRGLHVRGPCDRRLVDVRVDRNDLASGPRTLAAVARRDRRSTGGRRRAWGGRLAGEETWPTRSTPSATSSPALLPSCRARAPATATTPAASTSRMRSTLSGASSAADLPLPRPTRRAGRRRLRTP